MEERKRINAAIDANFNRALEGLRVCEDVFRFVLGESNLSIRIKKIRHDIVHKTKSFDYHRLLHGRDVQKDPIKFVDIESELQRASIEELVRKNLHRAAEAIRSLEEFSKLLQPDKGENTFQSIRFSLYALEKELISHLLRENKRQKFTNSLYAILDSSFVQGDEFSKTAINFIDGGASIIQLRMKGEPFKKVLAVARDISIICRERDVLFIINDYPDIACLTGADGVHLGQDDLPIEEVRRIIPLDMIVGISTHTMDEAMLACEERADYIAIGPVYDTKSKHSKLIKGIGLDVIEGLNKKINAPLVCIGGMEPSRVKELKNLGCSCFAVISYLFGKNDVEENCRKIVDAMEPEAY